MELPTPRYALKARYLFPVDGPPIADGLVVVAKGRIEAVVTAAPDCETIDLGNVAVIPGLVNAHVHLEFSGLDRPLGPRGSSLPDWIPRVLDYRARRGEAVAADILDGIGQAVRYGTTSLGEIATRDIAPDSELPAVDLIAFRELICFREEDEDQVVRCVERHLSAAENTVRWQAGISPHAPYTCLASTLEVAAEVSRLHQIPLAIHLAESQEEIEWMKTGGGPLGELLAAHNSATWPSPITSLDTLKMVNDAYRILIIHGNYLQENEIEALAQAGDRLSVVYCPRTHSFFQHAPYPLLRMLDAGVNVAIGTDGRGSNPDLNLLSDLRHLADQHPTVSPATVLQLGTLAGATALGIARRAGSITAGKDANLAVVPLPDTSVADPHELLLHSDLQVEYTISRGRIMN